MAAPSAPANIAVKQGLNPGAVLMVCDAVVATPAVASYTFYFDKVTGVSTSQYQGKRTVTKNQLEEEDMPYDKVFCVVTATNADGTSSAGTEASGWVAE
jgi:hypothetical protein